MNIEDQAAPRYIRPFALSFLVLVLAMAAAAAARETGLVEPDLGKRIAAAMMGLMIAACGNFLPKIARSLASGRETAAAFAAADRGAGVVVLLTGVVFSVIWISAPIDRAALRASFAGLGGFLTALGVWLWRVRAVPAYGAPVELTSAAVAGRLMIFVVLAGLFFGGLILQVDAIWGDAAAQPLALAVSVGLPAIAALILSVVYAVSRR